MSKPFTSSLNYSTSSLIKTRKDILCIMLAALAPVVFICLWMITNTQLPASDATDYFVTANRMYEYFISNGFWSGLTHLATERCWRPIFFPVLPVPFLLISHGSMAFAYHAVSALIVFVSAMYVYLLLRLQIDRTSAIVATSLVCFLPFFYMPIFTFMGEAALFPAIIGTLYHLIQSDYFRQKKHAIGFIICFSLALMIRPVEAATDLCLVLPVFIFSGAYYRIFSIKQIIATTGLIFLALFVFLLFTDIQIMRHSSPLLADKTSDVFKLSKLALKLSILTFSLALLSGILFTLKHFASTKRNHALHIHPSDHQHSSITLTLVFGTVLLIVLAWFLPYALGTLSWIFTTSFGLVAHVAIVSGDQPSLFEKIYSFIQREGLVTIIIVTLVAFLSLLTAQRSKIKTVISSSLILYLPLILPFPLWEVLNTIQSEPRKLGVALPGLIIALLAIGLQKGKWWTVRFAMIIILLIVQIVSAFSILYPQLPQINPDARYFGSYSKPITVFPNPHDIVFSFLDSQAEKHNLKTIDIVIKWNDSQPVYGYTLMMYKELLHRPYDIASYPIEPFENLKSRYDAVFLADNVNDMIMSDHSAKMYNNKYMNEINPALKNVYLFLQHYSQNNLAHVGWKLGPCIIVKGTDEKEYRGCLLFSLNRAENTTRPA